MTSDGMTADGMTADPLTLAACALCEVLDLENSALERLDVASAILLLTAKQAATDALLKAPRRAGVIASSDSRELASRLEGLAARNKLLLERAIIAQNRVMACIARAVPKTLANGGRYGATGQASSTAAISVAFSAKA